MASDATIDNRAEGLGKRHLPITHGLVGAGLGQKDNKMKMNLQNANRYGIDNINENKR